MGRNLSNSWQMIFLSATDAGFPSVTLRKCDSFTWVGQFCRHSAKSATGGRALISPAKAQTLSAELTGPVSHFPLPWSAYVRLLSVKDEQARKFYEAEALRGGWSVRQLDRQINSLFYERTALSRNKAKMLSKGALARSEDAITPEEEIKDPYFSNFSG